MAEFSPIAFEMQHQVKLDASTGVAIRNAIRHTRDIAEELVRGTRQFVYPGPATTQFLGLALTEDYQTGPLLAEIELTTGRLRGAVKEDERRRTQRERRARFLLDEETFLEQGVKPVSDYSNLSSRMNLILDRSIDEARLLREETIYPRHLLLALVKEPKSRFAEALVTTGTGIERVKAHVLHKLVGLPDPFKTDFKSQESTRPKDTIDVLRNLVDDPNTDPTWKAQMLKFIEEGIKRRPQNPL